MVIQVGKDTNGTRRTLKIRNKSVDYYSILAASAAGLGDFSKLPAVLKVLLENMLRFEDDGCTISTGDIKAFSDWVKQNGKNPHEIAYHPARILMQDFTGVPAIVDLAAMRDGIMKLGGKPEQINPLKPVDLIIDHSVMVDEFGVHSALQTNVDWEYKRNIERYAFLKWGQSAFKNFRVVPPGTGICHQVNLEYLSQTVWTDEDQNGQRVAYPDTLVGTDSHTTMVNGLAVLGWGVGGIEAEAAMLGQPISMLIPEVLGFELVGNMVEGTTGTDLVLKIVAMLRKKGVVGKFVEFFGSGLDNLPLADRATIANMAPEYGATCGFFPIDNETLRYLHNTGRDSSCIDLVRAYAKENGLWRDVDYAPVYTDTLRLDISTIKPAISGPKRPQDYVVLNKAKAAFSIEMEKTFKRPMGRRIPVVGEDYTMESGKVVIASITSCTNTSNPYVMICAGLVARKAAKLGLNRKPWVKTSLAPGSQVVSHYLEAAGLQKYLDKIGFNLVGYGCTTCIGNSGPIQEEISHAIAEGNLVVASVISGNRNFEGRISPHVRANYLASPPLVVLYSLTGTLNIDLTSEPIGRDTHGNDVFMRDVWPTQSEIAKLIEKTITREAFIEKYANVFKGDKRWQDIEITASQTYDWPMFSTYLQKPPYFQGITADIKSIENIEDARILAILGDMVTTDHISPAGSFKKTTPAGQYLISHQVPVQEFNSYGSRRGNHEVMMRGTFANTHIKNEILNDVEGGYTLGPDGVQTSVYEAAMAYQKDEKPLIIFGGEQYGAGSSRDWAAKGTALLGVKAVIAESFERIHRSNLISMGVIPFEFIGQTRKTLCLTGHETISIQGLDSLEPLQEVTCKITFADGSSNDFILRCRIDTQAETSYIRHGGILPYMLRSLAKKTCHLPI